MFANSLAITVAHFGEDHPAGAAPRFNLAALHELAGDLEQAYGLLAAALAIEERTQGAAHASTATTRVRVAAVLHKLGRHDEARAAAARALADVSSAPTDSGDRRSVEVVVRQILER